MLFGHGDVIDYFTCMDSIYTIRYKRKINSDTAMSK